MNKKGLKIEAHQNLDYDWDKRVREGGVAGGPFMQFNRIMIPRIKFIYAVLEI